MPMWVTWGDHNLGQLGVILIWVNLRWSRFWVNFVWSKFGSNCLIIESLFRWALMVICTFLKEGNCTPAWKKLKSKETKCIRTLVYFSMNWSFQSHLPWAKQCIVSVILGSNALFLIFLVFILHCWDITFFWTSLLRNFEECPRCPSNRKYEEI